MNLLRYKQLMGRSMAQLGRPQEQKADMKTP